MVTAILYYVKNLWPFSAIKSSDLRLSDGIVSKLSVPEHTKEFIFAIPEPESGAVIYVLCAQNLSERSALDAECLIREIKPDAVVVQVGHGVVDEVQSGEIKLTNDVDDQVPTSSFEVLRRCFIQKISKDNYENVAGNLVLKEIFGIHLHGHLRAAKRAAEEVGSSFLLLESPFVKCGEESNPTREYESGNKFQALALQPSSLVPQKVGSVVSSTSRRFFTMNDDLQLQMVKSLGLYFPQLSPVSNGAHGEFLPRGEYDVPSFARSVYPLLVDLHDIFVDIPSISSGLAHAQKMLDDVNKGKVDIKHLTEVYIFQIAVEGLRIALNNAGRLPINSMRNLATTGFSELDVEEKSHALLAEALRSQTKKFKSVVAVVDASGLAGLRKHWNVSVPSEIKGMVEQLITDCEDDDDENSNHSGKKRLLTSKPVVAVGAGATAVLGASSLSKVVPASSFMKVVSFKLPASLKLFLTQTQKVITIALSKTVGPSKVVAPGLTSTGAKASSALKATASAEKIRAVAHNMIASAEKTSLSAMRTSFYEIMRKRRIIRQIGVLPWATFGFSIATCSSLLMYGDGIECVAESFPSAPSIASLGRGIQSLHQASEAVRQAERSRIQKSIESLMYRLKRVKPNKLKV